MFMILVMKWILKLWKGFILLIPHLSIKDTKVHDVKTKEFLKIEKELKAKKQENKTLEEWLFKIEMFLENIK
jgi:hypothetical protein